MFLLLTHLLKSRDPTNNESLYQITSCIAAAAMLKMLMCFGIFGVIRLASSGRGLQRACCNARQDKAEAHQLL